MASPADHIDGLLDALGRNACKARRLLVAADGQDLMTEPGAPDHEGCPRDDHEHDDHLDRHAEETAQRDVLESVVAKYLQVAVGHDLRDAAAGDEQDQRGDDRLDRIARDEETVEPAENGSDDHRQCQRQSDRQRTILDRHDRAEEDHRRQRAGDGHQRAHREIDPARGNDERHAHGDDDDRGDLGKVHVERLPRKKIRRHRDVEGNQREEGEQRAVAAEPFERRPARALPQQACDRPS